MWMEAADYFYCREHHSLPIDPALVPYKETVKQILINRFQIYYRHEGLLSLLMTPLVDHLTNQFEQCIHEASIVGSRPSPPVFVFSGHDVTVLSLMNALKCKEVRSDPNFWPQYASCVIVELVRQTIPEDLPAYYIRLSMVDPFTDKPYPLQSELSNPAGLIEWNAWADMLSSLQQSQSSKLQFV